MARALRAKRHVERGLADFMARSWLGSGSVLVAARPEGPSTRWRGWLEQLRYQPQFSRKCRGVAPVGRVSCLVGRGGVVQLDNAARWTPRRWAMLRRARTGHAR